MKKRELRDGGGNETHEREMFQTGKEILQLEERRYFFFYFLLLYNRCKHIQTREGN